MLFSGSLGDPCIFQEGKGEGDPSMLIVHDDSTCEL
jgi:hypothetical protein